MSVQAVNQSTGALSPIAGGTFYTDLPIGSWIKWDDQTNMPDGFLKYGDTITQAEYPELYAMYGATVPYKPDKSELGAVNYPYTISTNSAAPTIMPYDGFISFGYLGTASSSPQYLTVWVNGAGIFNVHHANGGQERGMMTIPVKKGDSVYCNNQYDMNSSRWYDKTLIVKAKQTALPTDFEKIIDSKIPEYAHGEETVSLLATTATNVTITFPSGKFTSVPTVTATIKCQSMQVDNYNAWKEVSVIMKPDFTVTGGTIVLLNASSQALPVLLNWIAIN